MFHVLASALCAGRPPSTAGLYLLQMGTDSKSILPVGDLIKYIIHIHYCNRSKFCVSNDSLWSKIYYNHVCNKVVLNIFHPKPNNCVYKFYSVIFICRRGLIMYLLQLLLLTFALATAARPDLPLGAGYRDSIDAFRAICEAAILMFTLVTIGKEVSELV